MRNFKCFNETDCNLKKEIKVMENVLKKAIKKEGLKDIYFNVIIVDNPFIKNLNKNYRNIDKETDVISFALEDNLTSQDEIDNIRRLGDIYISKDVCSKQAEEYGNTFSEELSFLAIHGFLHLLGYDHMNKEDEVIMFEKQDILLGRK